MERFWIVPIDMRKLIILPLVFIAALSCNAQSKNAKAQKCFDQAFSHYNMGDDDAALKSLSCALKKDPLFSDAWSLQALIYEQRKDTANAVKSLRKALSSDPLQQYSYYSLAEYLFKLNRYEEAIATLEQFDKVPDAPGFIAKKHGVKESTKLAAAKLKESCKMVIEDSKNLEAMNIRNMGPNVNTTDWEYWPGMTIDGSVFIFTRMLNEQEDFYICKRNDSGWDKAVPLPGSINTPDNEGTTSVVADGRFIFYTVCNQDGYGSCDIYYSAFNPRNNAWSRRMNLGNVINGTHWDAQPSISADGRTLIFASSRPGGYGGKDLWLSRFSNGLWSEPVNLGATINSVFDEEAPYLHYDGKTLYFSSNGHPGYGSSDLFLSRKETQNGVAVWTKPMNMGSGINSSEDELGLYVDRKGAQAYFVSTREGGYGGPDIYTFDMTKNKQPAAVSFVRGLVYDADTKKEIYGRIEILDLNTNEVLLSDSSPYFFTTLTPGGNYAMNVYRKGYLFYSENFQPTASNVDSPFQIAAYLKPLKSDQTIVLKNIFFDVDKFDLKKESYAELAVVVELLAKNPGITIEISGHTDNSGSADYNKQLSENRAKSVKQYLVSKGAGTERISVKGLGATQPIDSNDTESGRANNRRIEMKIVGTGK